MTYAKTLLIVDDEVDFAKGLARLAASGYPELIVRIAHSGNEALAILETASVSLMLLDLNMPGMHGLDVIGEVRKKNASVSIIVLTAYGTVETAVSAIKQGAWDFLTKPVRREDLLHALAKALEHSALLDENLRLKQIMAESGLKRTLIGDSARMRELRGRITTMAPSAYTVLIQGESGTGKELVAEAIHSLSGRQGPLIKVNCPAIPAPLLESELFGHAKGAFTGAISAYRGLFAQATGGTLFLDEVGDIPPDVQTKLLRALQDGEVRPVGSGRPVRFDTRIIAATNQDLEVGIREGSFREDLFYRLNVLTVHAPPLRERREDIPLLAAHFVHQACAEVGTPPKTLSPTAVGALAAMDWPGNARELQNTLRRAVVFTNAPILSEHDLNLPHSAPSRAHHRPEIVTPYKEAKSILVDSFTRSYLADILTRTGGNVSEAARLSGLERVSLQKILRRLGLTGADFRA